MIQRFFAPLAIKILTGTSIALLLFAGFATHKWDYWKDKAGVLRIDLEQVRLLRKQDRANYENAQAAAEALAEAQKAKDAASYRSLAERTDHAEEDAARYRAAADRYARANRVHPQGPAAAAGAAGAAGGAGAGGAATGDHGPGGDAFVAVVRVEFDQLVENTRRLNQAHRWGEDLVAAGLATKLEN